MYCSTEKIANNSLCWNIALSPSMNKILDRDIHRIFNAFYNKYNRHYRKDKLFSYHMNCYPKCPAVHCADICRHSSKRPFVFGNVGDYESQK